MNYCTKIYDLAIMAAPRGLSVAPGHLLSDHRCLPPRKRGHAQGRADRRSCGEIFTIVICVNLGSLDIYMT